jgi:hypothetical protein
VCLIFWKAAWLKRINDNWTSMKQCAVKESIAAQPLNHSTDNHSIALPSCTESDVWSGTQAKDRQKSKVPRYTCQATQLPFFTTPLPWWDMRQYLEDYTSGNVTLGQFLRGAIYAGYYNLIQAGIGLGRPLRLFYDAFQAIWGGIPFPRRTGSIPTGQPTPTDALNLHPGELVRVKSYREILATLNTDNKNRGLRFDAELVPYCGGIYRVLNRVNKIIDEKTGKMLTMKTETVILEGVWCQARYSNCRMFCPRSIYSLWREIWLERVTEAR